MEKTRVFSAYADAAPIAALEIANPGLDQIQYHAHTKGAEKRMKRFIRLMEETLPQNVLPEVRALSSANCEAVAKFVKVKNLHQTQNGVCGAVTFNYAMTHWKHPTVKVRRDVHTAIKLVAKHGQIDGIDMFKVLLHNGDVAYFADYNGEQTMADAYRVARYYMDAKFKTAVNLAVPILPVTDRYSAQELFAPITAHFQGKSIRFSDVYMSLHVNMDTHNASKKEFARYRRDLYEFDEKFLMWVMRPQLEYPLFVAAIVI